MCCMGSFVVLNSRGRHAPDWNPVPYEPDCDLNAALRPLGHPDLYKNGMKKANQYIIMVVFEIQKREVVRSGIRTHAWRTRLRP